MRIRLCGPRRPHRKSRSLPTHRKQRKGEGCEYATSSAAVKVCAPLACPATCHHKAPGNQHEVVWPVLVTYPKSRLH